MNTLIRILPPTISGLKLALVIGGIAAIVLIFINHGILWGVVSIFAYAISILIINWLLVMAMGLFVNRFVIPQDNDNDSKSE